MASATPVTAQLPTSDRLSTLPVEVLTEIFLLAYTDTSPSEGPISRALLPFDRIHRFRRVKVDSPSRLNSLAVLLENGSMGAWIKEMEMNKVDGENGALSLQHRQLRTFFAALPNLAHLALNEGCPALSKLVLSQSLARNTLRKMECFSFVAPIEWKNPFEPTQFSILASYPSLRDVKIQSTLDFPAVRKVKPLTTKFQPLPLIESLTLILQGDGGTLRRLAKRLIAACPSLRHLEFGDKSYARDYTQLLPLLPQQLAFLSLRTRAFDEIDPFSCDALFSRLSNLEYLYLGQGTFSPSILSHLSSFPKLRTLGFGPGAVVSTTSLSTLFDESSPLPGLRRLILDNVEGKIGWRAMTDGKASLHLAARGPDYLAPDWRYPKFSTEGGAVTEGGLQALVDKERKLGAAAPVKIEGTSVAALDFSHAVEAELEDCAFLLAKRYGDFTEVVVVYGLQHVEERLEELGWPRVARCGGCGGYHY
ncbi:hypothetical protein JCM10207_003202 [Rhodosporidiobolus poonsookiae]